MIHSRRKAQNKRFISIITHLSKKARANPVFCGQFRFAIGQGGCHELKSIVFRPDSLPRSRSKRVLDRREQFKSSCLFLSLCHEESHRKIEADRRRKGGRGNPQGNLQNPENMFYTNRFVFVFIHHAGASRVQRIVELVQTSSPRSEATPDASRPIQEALMVLLSSRHC